MKFFKRYGLLFLINILVLIVIGSVSTFLGLDSYYTQYGLDYQKLAFICLLWGMGGAFISLFISKFMAKKFMGVEIVDERGPYRTLVTKVNEIAKRANMKKPPEIGVYQSNDMNAFATGPSESNSLVAFSTGLLNGMSDEELDGVIAHEISHITNGDMVTMTLLQGVMNAFVMFAARVVTFAIDNALRDDRGRGGLGPITHFFVVIALQVAFGFMAQFVVSYFSRFREYRADAGAAKLVGKNSMTAALSKLQSYYSLAYIKATPADSPFKSMQISSKSSIMKLLSTHPPLEQRIEALNRMQFS